MAACLGILVVGAIICILPFLWHEARQMPLVDITVHVLGLLGLTGACVRGIRWYRRHRA